MKTFPQRPLKRLVNKWANWPLKWKIKSTFKELRYRSSLFFYRVAGEGARKKPLVKLYKEGLILPSYDKPVCFFCSYDAESRVRENVYYYVDQLALAGFNIVFISSSETIRDADLKRLSLCCIRIINRENKGYDFYGWKTGLEEYREYKRHSGLLLANDSVLGPLFSINDIITRCENCDADIVGMTDSFHLHPHLQSYFLFCKKNVVLSEEFIRFFRQVDVLKSKIAIIRKYEMGFSQCLRRKFRLVALYGLEPVLARIAYRRRPIKWIEPTFHLWKPLIMEFKFPFLKKSVLTRRSVPFEEVVAALGESGSSYDRDIVNDFISSRR